MKRVIKIIGWVVLGWGILAIVGSLLSNWMQNYLRDCDIKHREYLLTSIESSLKEGIDRQDTALIRNSFQEISDNQGWFLDIDSVLIMEGLNILSESGDDYASLDLGNRYYHGIGVKQNPQKGMKYLNDLAKKGLPEAYIVLGNIYCKGEGVEKNVDKGVAYYEKAAAAGSAQGFYNLGVYNENSGNKDKAIEFYKKASELGFEQADEVLLELEGNH